MNYTVKYAINEYFKNKDINYLNEQTINNNISKYILFEAHHELQIFKNCINDIINNIDNYKQDIETYTQWNYINNENICKKLNNSNINNIPIYIKLINIPDINYYAQLESKKFHPEKIVIIINIFNHDKSILKVSLKHEFLHAFQSYIYTDTDILNTKKNTVDLINNDINLNIHLFYLIQRILYMINPIEQDARINATIEYIDSISFIPDIITNEKIINIIKNSDNINMLKEFQLYNTELSEDLENNQLKRIFYIGYYLNIHNIFSSHISLQKIQQIRKNNYKFNDEDLNIATNICNFYNKNLMKYQKRLYNAIYLKLKDN